MAGPLLALPVALVIDRIVGDPPAIWSRVPHPTVLMGRLIDRLDRRLNVETVTEASRRRRGILAVAALATTGAGIGLLLSLFVAALPFGSMIEALLASVLIAHKSLVDHVLAVAGALALSLGEGRRAVAKIVGRDADALDEAGVARAAIESAAENFSDAVVAPAFWYLLLGLPGLIVFKAVSTADSMIGHRTPRHAAFGWASARLDDLLNLIPARLAALFIALAVAASGKAAGAALTAAWRDAGSHRSPNAGWPEAAMAGGLGIAVGGPRRYGALVVDGAWLNGDGRRAADAADIRAAARLIDIAWLLLLLVVATIALIFLWTGR